MIRGYRNVNVFFSIVRTARNDPKFVSCKACHNKQVRGHWGSTACRHSTVKPFERFSQFSTAGGKCCHIVAAPARHWRTKARARILRTSSLASYVNETFHVMPEIEERVECNEPRTPYKRHIYCQSLDLRYAIPSCMTEHTRSARAWARCQSTHDRCLLLLI